MQRKKTNIILWTIFPILVGIFFASSVLSAFKIKNVEDPKNNQAAVVQLTASENLPQEKPKYFYTNNDTKGLPKISAKAFLVGDLNTGEVILSKNQDEKFPIASLSKLMTALVTKEATMPDEVAQVTKTALATYGKNGELKSGEKIKTNDLLYPLLLESSNDAAEVLAIHFGRDSFMAKMNEAAKKLKMDSTSYEDPSGLSENNQSTVSDMFKLTGYLLKQDPDLLKITTERSYNNKKHNWSNISQFLKEDGYMGGKSGYTDEALQTVVSTFALPLGKTGFRPIAITLLQSRDRYKDVENILKYLKKNIYYGGEADTNANWVEEKVLTPEIKEPNFVTLAFAGEIMLDRGVKNSVIKNFNNDYSALFEKSKDLSESLKKSDIVFATLEGPASDQGVDQKSLYSFRMDPGVIPAMKGAGISILSVATNHIGDFGREAFTDTLSRLEENEILSTGGGNNKKEAEAPTIIEKYGMKIGFLGFSDHGPNNMEAGADKAGILLASDPEFNGIIKNAAKQVDYLVVSLNFGEEYQEKHNQRQEDLAHRAVDEGAKVVIGSHTHVMQDTEIYKNSYIAYSLGNFIFDQAFRKETMEGMLLQIQLNKDGSMSVKKNIVELNSAFQPEKLIKGKEEKVKFPEENTSEPISQ